MKRNGIVRLSVVLTCLFCCVMSLAGRNKTISYAPVRLYAFGATAIGGVDIYDSDTLATLHNWNNPKQRIVWQAQLHKGTYRVRLKCSQPASGSAVALTVGGRHLASLIPSTGSWSKYAVTDLGVIEVKKSGETTVMLQGIQKGLEHAGNDEWTHQGAFPDINYIEFEPTDDRSQCEPTDILSKFKGKRLFDGKTMSGWRPNNGTQTLQWFRIEDHAIVGGSMDKDIPQNEFLCTDRQFANFELRLKFRADSTDTSYNGGIQFRSVQQPEPSRSFEMVGYQADINSYVRGAVYDEERRACFLGTTLDDNPPYFPGGWNEYVIRCEGPRIRVWLNGVQTLDYIEPYTEKEPHPRYGAMPLTGYIALQIHYAKASEIRYKDIMIEEL